MDYYVRNIKESRESNHSTIWMMKTTENIRHKLTFCQNYVRKLFDDERSQTQTSNASSGRQVTKDEVEAVMKK